MRLSLAAPWKIAAVLAIAGLLCAWYALICVRQWLAFHDSRSNDAAMLERALRLEPGNADYYYRLGVVAMFTQQDDEAALRNLGRATTLNPNNARYWLGLATAAHAAGEASLQAEAIAHAAEADPTTPDVAWEVGNFYLSSGNTTGALRSFRVNLASSAWSYDDVLLMCWRATHDADAIMRDALPPVPAVYFSFVQLLLQEHAAAEAGKVWRAAVALQQPIEPSAALPYVDNLLARGQIDEASQSWRQLTTTLPQLRRYIQSDNLVVNGGFDEPLLNAGFDWRFLPATTFTTALDSSDFHGGIRSLSVRFDGSPAGNIAYQFIAVEPNTAYKFSATMKSEELYTADSPRFLAEDAVSGANLISTESQAGTSVWHEVVANLRTGPTTRLLKLSFAQSTSAHIRGAIWVDDVRLVRQPR